MQFEIHHGDLIFRADLSNLSRSLYPNSEVYLVEGEEKKLIGYLFHKTLVYFAAEFADYAIKNYQYYQSSVNIEEARYCISFARKWNEDSSSVSIDEFKLRAAAASFRKTTHTNSAVRAAASAAWATCVECGITIADWVAGAAQAAAHAAGIRSPAEFRRQGIFILEFLKSDESFFFM